MFWLALLIGAIGAACLLWGILSSSRDSGRGIGIGIALFAIGTVFTIVACASTVEPRNVGVVTAFKKPTGETTGSGLQWTKPWETVADWDGSGKVYDHTGDRCVNVKIAGGGAACVDITVTWRAAVPRGPENFASYRKTGDSSAFDVFTDRRVEKPINSEVTSLFTSFDPFAGVTAGNLASGGLPPSPDLNGLFRQKLTDRINLAVGGGTQSGDKVVVDVDDPKTEGIEDDPEADIVVQAVMLNSIRYDDATTQRLASYGQKLLDGRNLAVDKANADTRADVARKQGMTAFQLECLKAGGPYVAFCGGASGAQATVPLPVPAN